VSDILDGLRNVLILVLRSLADRQTRRVAERIQQLEWELAGKPGIGYQNIEQILRGGLTINDARAAAGWRSFIPPPVNVYALEDRQRGRGVSSGDGSYYVK